MKLTQELKIRMEERELFQERLNGLLGIRPTMTAINTGNRTKGTFDLRTLNKALIEKCRQCATES